MTPSPKPASSETVETPLEMVQHYKRKIGKCLEHAEDVRSPGVIMHCLSRLERIPMTTKILEETGIGKVVNNVKRNFRSDETISGTSKNLIQIWRNVVLMDENEKDCVCVPGTKDCLKTAEENCACPPLPKLHRSSSSSSHSGDRKASSSHSSDRHHHHRSSSKRSDSKEEKKRKHSPSSEVDERDKERERKHKHSSSDSEERHSKKKKKKDKQNDISFESALMAAASTSSGSKDRKEPKPSPKPVVTKNTSQDSSKFNRLPSSSKANSNETKSQSFVPPKPPPLPPLFDMPLDISPNYSPMRKRPSFPSTSGGPSRLSTIRKFDDDAVIARSRNSQRTTVYSGHKRSVFGDSVPSLFDLCIHVLQEHVDDIAECGGLPFDILKPVLERAKPDTLMSIEECNPYLMEDTGHLWEAFSKKTFPKDTRRENESWREMYERCTTERDERLTFLTEKVQQSYKNVSTNSKKTKLAYVDAVAKPPRNVQRAQDRNGTGLPVGQPVRPTGGPPRPRGEPVIGGGRAPRMVTPKAKMAPMMAKTMKLVKGIKTNFRK